MNPLGFEFKDQVTGANFNHVNQGFTDKINSQLAKMTTEADGHLSNLDTALPNIKSTAQKKFTLTLTRMQRYLNWLTARMQHELVRTVQKQSVARSRNFTATLDKPLRRN
jgi:hypothetical protein